VGVVDVDAVTVVVLEPKRLPRFARDARGMLLLLASLDLFDPHSLTGGPGPPVSV
jgi:hypothetical protein